MSYVKTITSEELFEYVKPWDPEQWGKFIREYIIPIHELSKYVAGSFSGDASARVVHSVFKSADRVVKAAERVLGRIDASYEVPRDPLEAARQLLEFVANIFLGVGEGGKYTLFAWTLRRIPREYIGEMYSKLDQDGEARRKVFEMLGVEEILKPQIESPLVERIALLGYPDYLRGRLIGSRGTELEVLVTPPRKTTLGGSICRLIDSLPALLKRPGLLSKIELSVQDLATEYLRRAGSLVTTSTISYNKDISWREFARFTSPTVLFASSLYFIEGITIKSIRKLSPYGTPEYVEKEGDLLDFLRKITPSLVLGILDLVIVDNGRFIILIKRE